MPEQHIERVDSRRADEINAIEIRGYPHPWSLKIIQDTFKAGTACWALLDAQGRVQAYAFFSIAVGEAQLLNLCVDPDQHGKGLGRQLMQHLLQVAREEFCTIFLLEVRRSNTAARRLYESLGFNTLGVRKGYYPNGPGATEDALVMGYEIT
ncbi:MAG: ribosomal protein S18-alanine N-acetyltransferase [Pseudomonadota bacterium]